jgi:hypothetical protein
MDAATASRLAVTIRTEVVEAMKVAQADPDPGIQELAECDIFALTQGEVVK